MASSVIQHAILEIRQAPSSQRGLPAPKDLGSGELEREIPTELVLCCFAAEVCDSGGAFFGSPVGENVLAQSVQHKCPQQALCGLKQRWLRNKPAFRAVVH